MNRVPVVSSLMWLSCRRLQKNHPQGAITCIFLGVGNGGTSNHDVFGEASQ